MPIPRKYLADFTENGIYHIYNRTNNREPLFLNEENRRFFLQQYKKFISPIADTYAWNLLPNHFHFIVKIKDIAAITTLIKKTDQHFIIEKKFLRNEITLSVLVEHYFKRFFQSYAISFNNVNNRNGNLFYKPFKRVLISDASQLTMAIVYVHANTAKHQLVKSVDAWKWSSWHSFISTLPTMLARDQVIDWFGGMKQFIQIHREMAVHFYHCDSAIEDD